MLKILLLLLTPFLLSCASVRITYDGDKVVKIDGRGLQETEISPDGTIKHKMAMNWWPKDFVNFVIGAKN